MLGNSPANMETGPLLQGEVQDAVEGTKTNEVYTSWKQEAKIIAIWSGPLILTTLLQRSINLVRVFAVGRIGTKELGAVTVASITTNMIGNTLVQGLANCLDTLGAQAYGSGQKHLVGLHMQQMICFTLLCIVPLMVLWWKAKDILVYILPDQEVADLAGIYLRIMTLRFPAFVFFDCGKRFFQAQGLFSAPTYVVLIAAPLNVFIMWLFVWHFAWGFVGAPIAIVITGNLTVALVLLYGGLIDGLQCWGGFSKGAFRNWGNAAEEVLTLAAAQFGTAQLAAQSALVTLIQIAFITPFGISIAGSIRVANWIGARAKDEASSLCESCLLSIVFGLILSFVNSVILLSLRYELPRLFTKNPEVIEVVAKTMPIITTMIVFDTMSAFSHGLLKAVGCLEIGGYINLVAYYLIALSISFNTAFFLGWQLDGLWTGMATGLCIVSTIEFWWLYHSDWDDTIQRAAYRNELC